MFHVQKIKQPNYFTLGTSLCYQGHKYRHQTQGMHDIAQALKANVQIFKTFQNVTNDLFVNYESKDFHKSNKRKYFLKFQNRCEDVLMKCHVDFSEYTNTIASKRKQWPYGL